jgi:DNA polymerase III epsilon subunit-like protein
MEWLPSNTEPNTQMNQPNTAPIKKPSHYNRLQREAIETANSWLSPESVVVFDIEGTGLEADAEIIEITIMDMAGNVLVDTLVKPSSSFQRKPPPTTASPMKWLLEHQRGQRFIIWSSPR